MTVWAAAHPGKIGDALYTLPMLRYLSRTHGVTFDFYTSKYCEPLKRLFEYQSCINRFIISDTYQVERMDMGCQPAHVPIPNEYEQVYQCGFTSVPDGMLHQFIAKQHGITIPLAVEYEYPQASVGSPVTPGALPDEYVCLAPRGDSSYGRVFDEVADRTACVVIGGRGDYRGRGYDLSGLDLLYTLTVLSGARGFVGLMSSQLVLANGFSYPKVVPHDNRSWDMRHVVNQASNIYLINPSVEQVLRHING